MTDLHTETFTTLNQVLQALAAEGIKVDCYTGSLDYAILWTPEEEIIGHFCSTKGYKHDGLWSQDV